MARSVSDRAPAPIGAGAKFHRAVDDAATGAATTVLGIARLHLALTEPQLRRRAARGATVLMWNRVQARDNTGKNFVCHCTFDDGLADESVPFELAAAIDLSGDWQDRIESAIDGVMPQRLQ